MFYLVGKFESGVGVALMLVKFSFLLLALLFASLLIVKRGWLVRSEKLSVLVFLFFSLSVAYDFYESGLGWKDVYGASWAGVFILLALLKMLAVFWVSIGYFKLVNVFSVLAEKVIYTLRSARRSG